VDRLLVLFVGRLVEKKGYDLLLRAADPAYEMVFAGDGSDRRLLDGRPGVHHLGALPPAALADMYRACDIFALPSESEGFPLTVQEAMASGLPVVTTDDPGYAPYGLSREHVTLLPRDAGRLRTALRSLADDAARRERAGAWSRRFAVANFAWEEHATHLLGRYDRALTGRRVAHG
jgi:glycosyltransferase involved in cell wall biosynthesis